MDYQDLENTVEDHEDRLGAIEDLDLPDYTDTNDENIADLQQNEGQLTFPLSQDTIDLLNENSTDFLQLPDTITLLNSLLSIVSINGRSHGTGVTSITSGSPTKLTPTANDFANGITWDASNYRFTVSTAGQYSVIAFVYFNSGDGDAAGKLHQVMIYKNGSEASKSNVYSAVSNSGLSIFSTDIFDCAVNDYFEIWVEQFTGGNRSVYNGNETVYLSIAKI